MNFRYIPSNSVSIDGVLLEFGESRAKIRTKIKNTYVEQNKLIELGEDVAPINKRRDIYEYEDGSLFFLNYNDFDLLRDVEVHNCKEIRIFDVVFNFDDDLDIIGEKLSRFSEEFEVLSGEYLFSELKLVIVNKEQMGAKGNSIGYFYCSSDIMHLTK